jgi:hypothetical protein
LLEERKKIDLINKLISSFISRNNGSITSRGYDANKYVEFASASASASASGSRTNGIR